MIENSTANLSLFKKVLLICQEIGAKAIWVQVASKIFMKEPQPISMLLSTSISYYFLKIPKSYSFRIGNICWPCVP